MIQYEMCVQVCSIPASILNRPHEKTVLSESSPNRQPRIQLEPIKQQREATRWKKNNTLGKSATKLNTNGAVIFFCFISTL